MNVGGVLEIEVGGGGREQQLDCQTWTQHTCTQAGGDRVGRGVSETKDPNW